MTRTLGTLVKFCDIGRFNIFVYIAITVQIVIILETLNLDISQDPSMSKSRHAYIYIYIYICDWIYKISYFPINGKLDNNMVHDLRQTTWHHIAEECNLNVVNFICCLSEWWSEVYIDCHWEQRQDRGIVQLQTDHQLGGMGRGRR
jgi:hypothetical protein